jgi:hypothetical protein
VTVFVIVTRGFQLSIHLLILTVAITVVAPIVLATTVIGLRPAVVSFPAYFVGAVANQYFYVEALIREWVLRRRTNVWIKGH